MLDRVRVAMATSLRATGPARSSLQPSDSETRRKLAQPTANQSQPSKESRKNRKQLETLPEIWKLGKPTDAIFTFFEKEGKIPLIQNGSVHVGCVLSTADHSLYRGTDTNSIHKNSRIHHLLRLFHCIPILPC